MYIDLHSDTIFSLEAFEANRLQSLEENTLVLNASSLRRNRIWQAFALYVPGKHFFPGLSPWEILNRLHDRFLKETAASALPVMTKASDLKEGYGAILTTEEGGSIEGDLSRLSTLASWGVKSFGFTWNYENALGYPNSRDKETMEKGLKDKGIEAIGECERLGILVDVSHLSDGGFWDVVQYSRKPFLATHSNARSLMDHPRNLTDSMIRALAEKGGVAGLNFCPPFLSETGKGEVEALADHVMHLYQTGGEDVLAIGTDFDGFEGEGEIPGPDGMENLFETLKMKGMSERVLEKLQSGNARRVFSEAEV